MESAKYLIVGGGAAGTTAATAVRERDADGRIVIVDAEPHRLYSRVALPAYTRGKTTLDRLFLKEPHFYDERNIERWPERHAASLDATDKIVTLTDGERIGFDKLLIASGARPRSWRVPGAQLDGVLSLRRLEDAEEIKRRVERAKHAVIVGGGFIGLEHLQTLTQAGVHTSVLVRGPHYWSGRVDEESGRLLQSIFDREALADFRYLSDVSEVVGRDKVQALMLTNGKQLPADLVLVNIGIDLNTEWLQTAGLQMSHGVLTDEYMRTSIDDIFAAGDAAVFYDPTVESHHHQGNWQNATTTGRLAGLNMAGDNQPIDTVSGYTISAFGKNISFVGWTLPHQSMTIVPRGSARSGAYGRILTDGTRVLGATLINRFPDREPLSQLMRTKVSVAKHLADLADETVSLRDLAAHLISRHSLTANR